MLIQGTGEVRAGIWSRSVCIKEGFQTGSMLPFITKCIEKDVAVLVMNPNENLKDSKLIAGSETMQKHAVYVWNRFVKESGFTDISVVAHSAGGACLSAILSTFKDSFFEQVKSIAYTDSWVVDKS